MPSRWTPPERQRGFQVPLSHVVNTEGLLCLHISKNSQAPKGLLHHVEEALPPAGTQAGFYGEVGSQARARGEDDEKVREWRRWRPLRDHVAIRGMNSQL